mmetsp:Transcript_24934/g.52064  ORF Transcript_24934/g.52064 Transcript_24934/m.52064 type:complete len:82 (+) Transcript_24934:1280-1525(+)
MKARCKRNKPAETMLLVLLTNGRICFAILGGPANITTALMINLCWSWIDNGREKKKTHSDAVGSSHVTLPTPQEVVGERLS